MSISFISSYLTLQLQSGDIDRLTCCRKLVVNSYEYRWYPCVFLETHKYLYNKVYCSSIIHYTFGNILFSYYPVLCLYSIILTVTTKLTIDPLLIKHCSVLQFTSWSSSLIISNV